MPKGVEDRISHVNMNETCKNVSCFTTLTYTEFTNVTDSWEPRENAYLCDVYSFIFAVVIGILVVFGLVGNAVSIVVLWKNKRKLTTSTSFLLSSLAVCDSVLLFTFFIMKTLPAFSTFLDILPDFHIVYPYVEVYGWPTLTVAHAVTTWVTCLVAVHRYIGVTMPLRGKIWCRTSLARKQLFAVVVFSIAFELPLFFDRYVSVREDPPGEYYYETEYAALSRNHAYVFGYKTVCYYLVMYFVPLCLLTFISIRLIKTLREANTFRLSLMGGQTSNHDCNSASTGVKKENTEKAKRVSREKTGILVTLVLVFLTCQIWEPIRRALEAANPEEHQQACGTPYFYFSELPSLMAAFNSSINFVIYCVLGRTFRKTLRSMSCCKVRANDSEITNSINKIQDGKANGTVEIGSVSGRVTCNNSISNVSRKNDITLITHL